MSSFKRSLHRYQHACFQDPHMRYHRSGPPSRDRQNEEQQPLFREDHPDVVPGITASEVRTQSVAPILSRATRFHVAIVQAGMSTRSTVNTTLHRVSERKRQMTSWVSRSINSTKTYLVTNSKRLLGYACILMLILNVVQSAEIVRSRLSPSKTTEDASPTSMRIASRILQNLHPSYRMMDPCDDFEEYTCGGFRTSNQLHDYQNLVSSRTLMEDDLHIKLHRIFTQNDTLFEKDDMEILSKAKSSYYACVDEDRIRERGLSPLQDVVGEICNSFGSQMFRSKRSSTDQRFFSMNVTAQNNLANPTIQLIELGVNPFLSMEIRVRDKAYLIAHTDCWQADLQDPMLQSLFVMPTRHIGLPSADCYEDPSLLVNYGDAIEESLRYVLSSSGNDLCAENLSTDTDAIRSMIHDIVELESRLVPTIPSDTELWNVSRYKRMTITELDSLIPQFPVREIIRQLAPSLHSNRTVIVPSVEYLQALSKVLATTPTSVVHGFMIWKVVQSYAEAIDHRSLENWKTLLNTLSGKRLNAREDRWLTCVRKVNTDLGWIMSKLYIEREFVDEARDSTNEMTQGVIESFSQIITVSSWMIQEDKTKALSKLRLMRSKIGFPSQHPNIRNAAEIDAIYKTVIINNTTYFENQMQIRKAEVLREWSKLGQSTDGNQWTSVPTTVDLSYDFSSNAITVPAAIIREPLFYGDDVPSALLYGGLGAIIGHEVVHGFDNVGNQYNEVGKVVDWWSNTTRINFDERFECLQGQYLLYDVGGTTVDVYTNNSLTLNEIIADAGGVHAAYDAWTQREA